jgi:hypothetical protein
MLSPRQSWGTKGESKKTKAKTKIEEFDYLDFWTMEPGI